MKTRSVYMVIFLILATLLSSCSAAGLPSASSAQPARTLTISGTGRILMKPDTAYIYIGVHTEKPGAAEAVAENNTNIQKLIDALKSAGVDQNDIQTSNFSIWQNTQYGTDGQPIGTNYVVDNTVYLTVRNLDSLGNLLDTAVKAGANNVNSIQFDVADKTQALSDARTQAVKNANAQAAELASVAGVGLGKIQSIQYYDSTPAPIYSGKAMGGGGVAMEAAVPITPGQMEISVTVTIAYDIK